MRTGLYALLVVSAIVYVVWMTGVALYRTRERNKNKSKD